MVIDRSPGEGSGGGGGDGGSGGALTATTTTQAGGGGAAPADECDGIEATGGQPIGAGTEELLQNIVFPHRLRLDDTAVYSVSYDAGAHAIHRAHKASPGSPQQIAGGVPIVWDLAVAGGKAMILTQDSICEEGCPAGPSKIHAVDVTGGPLSLLAVLDGHETYTLVAGKAGLYTVDFATEELLFVPFAGGPFQVVATGAGTELSAGKDRIYFLAKPYSGNLTVYDELTGAVTGLWQNENPIRSIRQRGDGPVYFLASTPSSRLRRLQGGVAETVLCLPHFAFDVAIGLTHAYVAAEQPDAFDDSPGPGPISIWRVPLAGGPPELVLEDLPQAIEIEVDETHLYWITHDYPTKEYGVWRMPLPPG